MLKSELIGANKSLSNLSDTPLNLLANASVPSSPSDSGSEGEWALDGTYMYICISTDTWKRIEMLTWVANNFVFADGNNFVFADGNNFVFN